MAGLIVRRKRYVEAGRVLNRLAEGDTDRPVSESECKDKDMRAKLDRVRWRMVEMKDEAAEKERKNREAIAAVAHDLKTPIAVIAGYTEAMADGIYGEEYFDKILQKTTEMNETVLSLVESARADGEKNGNFRQVGARAYWEGVLSNLAVITEESGVRLKWSKIPDVTLRINENEVARVIQNLVTNALRYVGDKKRIEVSFSKKNARLYVSVRDFGTGMKKEAAEHVFDRFYRAESARTERNSGLGLYIAKTVVENHGGAIGVRSRPGKGTCFTFYLPLIFVSGKNRNLSGTAFERMPRVARILLVLLFGWVFGCSYRFSRFRYTGTISTLIGGFVAIGLMPLVWVFDLIDVALTGRISYLCD